MKKRIAIPLLNNMLCMHFGHCEEFIIFNTDEKGISREERLTPPPHESGAIPNWLHKQDVTDVIAGGIGQQAIEILLQNKMNVYVGVAPKPAEELVKDLLNGNLQDGVNLCDH